MEWVKDEDQHVFARRASEMLKTCGIPELGRCVYGNPIIETEFLSRLPKKLKADLELVGCWRVIVKSYKQ